MAFNELYRRQVALLIRILPYVGQEQEFALKGGTAINLFVRNMPRLSVDIDLTYLPVAPRAESLAAIDTAMKRIAQGKSLPIISVTPNRPSASREADAPADLDMACRRAASIIPKDV